MTTTPFQRGGARLPQEFADVLNTLRRAGDPRLAATLQAAKDAGWSLRLLGHTLGVTGDRITQLIKKGDGQDHGPIPPIPAVPALAPKKKAQRPPEIELTADEADALQAMYRADPFKQDGISANLRAKVLSLWESGASMPHLADILDTDVNTIHMFVANARAGIAKREVGFPPAPVPAADAESYSETIEEAKARRAEQDKAEDAKRAERARLAKEAEAAEKKYLDLCQRRFLKPLNDQVTAEHEGQRWYRCTKCRKKILRDAINPYSHRCF